MPSRRSPLRRLVSAAALFSFLLCGRAGTAAGGAGLLQWAHRLIEGVTPQTNL